MCLSSGGFAFQSSNGSLFYYSDDHKYYNDNDNDNDNVKDNDMCSNNKNDGRFTLNKSYFKCQKVFRVQIHITRKLYSRYTVLCNFVNYDV